MARLSVIMSTYNEKENELLLAVHSVLNQTYTDFEFIIVCDNPENSDLCSLLESIEQTDSRIKIVWNEKNMGLAMSLNHGYQYAEGKYIARMDADDICEINRFEAQMKIMESLKRDLVWSSYSYIDEQGEALNETVPFYEKKEILKNLPYKNIIHHPTVIMRREAFEKAGLYRDFPCSQDYDLWLRMLYLGADMQMMEEKLLKYRVRSNSVTSKKKYQQICTLNYIRGLYRERKRTGSDSYSYENYQKYLKEWGVGQPREEEAFSRANQLICEGKLALKRRKVFSGFHKFLQAYLGSRNYRKNSMLILKRKIRGM